MAGGVVDKPGVGRSGVGGFEVAGGGNVGCDAIVAVATPALRTDPATGTSAIAVLIACEAGAGWVGVSADEGIGAAGSAEGPPVTDGEGEEAG